MSYLEELLPEFRKGAKIRYKGWGKDTYIEMNKSTGVIITNEGRRYLFSYEDFTHSCWELYKEPELDWDYIIKNKCLCWFFDSNEEVIGSAGILKEVKSREEYAFIKIFNGIKFAYQHCRPVRRDEVTFYEDRKDD